MKLFKWIAADPEKLDKKEWHSAIYKDVRPCNLFYAVQGKWLMDFEDIPDDDWVNLQVLVDAEVSEGEFFQIILWAVKSKTLAHYGGDAVIFGGKCYSPHQAPELYQEFLKQL